MTTEDVALALLKSQIERCILLQLDALWFKEQIPVSWDAALQFKLEAAKCKAHEEALWYQRNIFRLMKDNHVKGEADATKS